MKHQGCVTVAFPDRPVIVWSAKNQPGLGERFWRRGVGGQPKECLEAKSWVCAMEVLVNPPKQTGAGQGVRATCLPALTQQDGFDGEEPWISIGERLYRKQQSGMDVGWGWESLAWQACDWRAPVFFTIIGWCWESSYKLNFCFPLHWWAFFRQGMSCLWINAKLLGEINLEMLVCWG